MKRILAAILAALLAANALAMLAAPLSWYGVAPGVPATGPFNPHFVRDIGAAYLTVVLGLGWFSVRPMQGWAALVGAAAFLDLHALVHLHDAALSPVCGHDLARDFPGVFLPALIATALAAFPKTR
jgi:hypothetical protein